MRLVGVLAVDAFEPRTHEPVDDQQRRSRQRHHSVEARRSIRKVPLQQ
jgi:hypothetical protein